MRHQNQVLLLAFLCVCFSHCNSTPNKISSNEKLDVSLGSNSKYRIEIWDSYGIETKDGPDFTVYYLSPVDTINKAFGNAGIYFGGHPQQIRPDSEKKLLKDTLMPGNLLGNKITWTIFDYGSSLSAETILQLDDYNKISAFAYAQNYSNIDSLINVLESLRHVE